MCAFAPDANLIRFLVNRWIGTIRIAGATDLCSGGGYWNGLILGGAGYRKAR
jgi:hypothetical protein